MTPFQDLPNAQHVAIARNRLGDEWLEERLYRTPAGEWFIRQAGLPDDYIGEDDVIAWLEARHSVLVSLVSVERPDPVIGELIAAGYLKAA